MYTYLEAQTIRRLRSCLRKLLPGAKSSHVAEATAAALGFRTAVSLSHTMRGGPGVFAWAVEFSQARFASRLVELGDTRSLADLRGVACRSVPLVCRSLDEDIHLLVSACSARDCNAYISLSADARTACAWTGSLFPQSTWPISPEWALGIEEQTCSLSIRHDGCHPDYRTAVITGSRMPAPEVVETQVIWNRHKDGGSLLCLQPQTTRRLAQSKRRTAEFIGRVKMASLEEGYVETPLSMSLWNTPAQSGGIEEDARFVAEDFLKAAATSDGEFPVYPTTQVACRLKWTQERACAAVDALVEMGHVYMGRGIFLFAKPSLVEFVAGPAATFSGADQASGGLGVPARHPVP
jgi:hypothetical protein